MKGRNQCGGSRPFPLFWLGETRAAGFARGPSSEELRAVRSRRGPELLPPQVCDDAAARRALKETELQQERLVHVLDRVLLLAERDGQRREAHRPAAQLEEDRGEKLPGDSLETAVVPLEQLERLPCHLVRDHAVVLHLGHVSHPPEDAVRDPRRTARTPCDLV